MRIRVSVRAELRFRVEVEGLWFPFGGHSPASHVCTPPYGGSHHAHHGVREAHPLPFHPRTQDPDESYIRMPSPAHPKATH